MLETKTINTKALYVAAESRNQLQVKEMNLFYSIFHFAKIVKLTLSPKYENVSFCTDDRHHSDSF